LARGEDINRPAKDVATDPLFKDFAQTWFDEYVVLNNKFSEQHTKMCVLRSSLVPFFGKMQVGEITARHIERYKAAAMLEGVTNKTITNRLMVLNKCLGTAYEWFEWEKRPPKIKWPKCEPTNAEYLSPDECQLLLSHAEGVVHGMILTAVRTGMRLGELKGLQWSSIDWEERSLTVRHSRDDRMKILVAPKNNRIRHIPLHIDVYEFLYRSKKDTGYVFVDTDGQPFDEKRLSRRLAAVRKKAGLRHFGWHALRHTFASHLVMRGVPLTAVKELMGHADVATTMRYAHLDSSTLRAAIDMLDPRTMGPSDFGQPVGNLWLLRQMQAITQKRPAPKAL
jgi:integrase